VLKGSNPKFRAARQHRAKIGGFNLPKEELSMATKKKAAKKKKK
jgi:hypothetical protein